MNFYFLMSELFPYKRWEIMWSGESKNGVLVNPEDALPTYESIEWPEGVEPLTFDECVAEWERLEPRWLALPYRTNRQIALELSDWTQLPNSALSDEKIQEWADYRQALRDLDFSVDNLDSIVWPEPPV